MEHQDWAPVIIGRNANGKSSNQLSKGTSKAQYERPPKQIQAALNNEGMPNRIEKIDKKVSQNIQNARNALGISRKELAQKINEKETLVAEYENGTAIPSAGILNKIDKVLKTKVRVTF